MLARRGDEWVVRAAGRVLMSSRVHGSEEALAAVALRAWRSTAAAAGRRPRAVLLAGIGLGFTLRALLDRAPPDTRVVVVELVPELAAWVRGRVAHLAERPLDDPRVRLQIGDVMPRIAESNGAYDLILLDVDNGPTPLVHRANEGLYGARGVQACHRALRGGGVLAVWSAGPDQRYLERLERGGFSPEQHVVTAGQGSGARHAILLGVKSPRASR